LLNSISSVVFDILRSEHIGVTSLTFQCHVSRDVIGHVQGRKSRGGQGDTPHQLHCPLKLSEDTGHVVNTWNMSHYFQH